MVCINYIDTFLIDFLIRLFKVNVFADIQRVAFDQDFNQFS